LRTFIVKYVPGEINPADIASRGCTFDQLKNEHYSRWFHGPPWLQTSCDQWETPKEIYNPGDENNEKENQEPFSEIVCVNVHQQYVSILDHSKYETLTQIRMTMVYTLRQMDQSTRETIENDHTKLAPLIFSYFVPGEGPISHEEFHFALRILIGESQKLHPPSEDIRRELRLYEDTDGLLRCEGRFPESDENKEKYFPLYLPKEAAFTSLMLRHMHITHHHCGPTTLMAVYRQRLWTPQLRRLIRHIILKDPATKCIECARFHAKPCLEAQEPALMPERLDTGTPFSFIGIDFFGPFRVRTPGST